MSDAWIISPRRFKEHSTFEAAEAELYRLQTAHPDKNLRIYRIKTGLQQSGAVPRLIDAVKRLLEVHPVPVMVGGIVDTDFRKRVDQISAEDEVRSVLSEMEIRIKPPDQLKEAAQ